MSPTTPRVSFVRFPSDGSPVTGESRSPSRFEAASFEHFTSHADHCPACKNCYDNYPYGGRLCSIGRDLAQEMLRYVYPEHDSVYVKNTSILTRLELDDRRHRQVRQVMRLVERHGSAALESVAQSVRPPRPDSGVYMDTLPAEFPIYTPGQPLMYDYRGAPYVYSPVAPVAPVPPVVYTPSPPPIYIPDRRRPRSPTTSPSEERSSSVRATVGSRYTDVPVPGRRGSRRSRR